MKQTIFLAMFLVISALCSAQAAHPNYTTQLWFNTPTYSNGGYSKLVLNSTTNRMESTPNTLLSGKVVTEIETDSSRNYSHIGASLCVIKWLSRDTVTLVKSNYASNQTFKFMVVASGADTTVFKPSSGNINGSSTYTMTGTNNSLSLYYDGTNFWITK